MRHVITIGDVTFVHKGDGTGIIGIEQGDQRVEVPFATLKAIIADSVRTERISKLKDMSDDELLS